MLVLCIYCYYPKSKYAAIWKQVINQYLVIALITGTQLEEPLNLNNSAIQAKGFDCESELS